MGQGINAILGFRSFEKENFSKVYNVLDNIPEYGGQSTWPLVIAMIGLKACLVYKLLFVIKKSLLLRTEFWSLTGQNPIKVIYY